MKNRACGLLSATIVIAAGLTGLSSAAVIGGSGVSGYSYTNSISQSASGSFSLNQFDSALGTLTGVSITFSMADWNSSYSFSHNDTVTLLAGSTGGTRVTLKLTDAVGNLLTARADQELVAEDTTYTGAGVESISGLPAASDTKTSNQNAAWASTNGLIGTGTKSFSYAGLQVQSLSTSGASTANVLSQTMTGNIAASVTYTYDAAPIAAVPEPSEFLLGGVPAFLGGFALLRRRAVRKSGSSVA
jgi:hypothetical protein